MQRRKVEKIAAEVLKAKKKIKDVQLAALHYWVTARLQVIAWMESDF